MIVNIFLWLATLIYCGFAINVLIAQVASILATRAEEKKMLKKDV
jgi:hypothetical protein